MEDKKLRLGLDTTSVENAFERINKKAQEAFISMNDQIKKSDASLKQLLTSMERQISLMEKESTEDWQRDRKKWEKYLDSHPDSEKAKTRISEIDERRREESKVVDELRKIQATLTENSRKEILEDRKNIQDTLNNTPREQWTLQQRVQAATLQEIQEEERKKEQELLLEKRRQEQSDKKDRIIDSGTASVVRGFGSNAINSNNIVDMGFGMVNQTGGMLTGAGFAGAGVLLALGGMLGKKLWDISMQYYKQAGTAFAMTGSDVNRASAMGMTDYGFSAIDFSSRIAPLARMRRSGVGIESAVRNQLLFNKGIGLDESLFGQMEQLSLLSGGTGGGNIQSAIAAMRAGGIVKGGDMSSVNDYLQLIAVSSKEQVTRLGRIDVGVNTKMVAALSSMDEMLAKSPEALQTMFTNVRGGLMGGSQQAQALQYSVLSRMAPGASMFELMEMRENPFSERSQKYLPNFLKQLHSMSGGRNEDFFANIMQQFNLSASMSRILGSGFLKGNLDEVLKKNFEGETGVDIESRAGKATTAQEKLNAETVNLQIKAVDSLIDVKDAIVKQAAKIEENNREVRKLSEALLEDSNFWKRLYGALIQAGQTNAFSR